MSPRLSSLGLLAHRTLSASLLGLVLAALVASANGCGEGAEMSTSRAGAECVDDDACGGGAFCVGGVCNVTRAPVRITLRVDPPEFRSDLVRELLPDQRIAFGDQLAPIALGPPVRLQGIVRWDDDDATLGPLAADVVVRSTVESGGSFAANVRVNTTNGRFDLDVPPGRYDIVVLPDRTNVPRRVFNDFVVRREDADGSCGGERLCIFAAFVVPAPGRYVRLQGELLQQTPQLLPMEGVRVWATSEDGRLLSTSTNTDMDGRFTLFAPPTDAAWRFLVSTGDGPRIPSASFELLDPGAIDADGDIQLWANDWSRRYRVYGKVTNVSTELLDRLVITGRQRLEPGPLDQAALEVLDGTDDVRVDGATIAADGTFALDLLPGRYLFEAACSDGTCLSPAPVRVDVDTSSEPIQWNDAPSITPPSSFDTPLFEVPIAIQAPVEGLVWVQQRPIRGARVEAELVRSAEDAPTRLSLDSSVLNQATETDEEGRWRLELLPGRWTFRVTPPADGPPLPVWETTYRVEPSTRTLPPFEPLAGGSFTGTVVTANGVSLAGAPVEAWLLIGDTRRSLGRTRSAEDGFFRFIIPDVSSFDSP
jgi:hypothetical protein